jgi:hypothetical protein
VLPTGIGEIDVVRDFSAAVAAVKVSGPKLALQFKLAELPNEKSEDPKDQEAVRTFLSSQTLFRAYLSKKDGIVALGHHLVSNFYRDKISEHYWSSYWAPAKEAALKVAEAYFDAEAEIGAIELSRNAEIAYDLHKYLSTRATERHRLSLLFSLCMPWAAAGLELYASDKAACKNFFTEEEMENAAVSLALRASVAYENKEGAAYSYAQMHLAVRFILDVYRSSVGLCADTGLPAADSKLIDALENKYGKVSSGNPAEINRVLMLLSSTAPDLFAETMVDFPYSSVFEDVLYHPEEIEKHYCFSNSDDGFIYLGHDPALDRIWHKPSVKVGKSIDPERRGRQLAGQCLPRPLRIHRVWYVSDMRRAEQLVFQSLQRKRAKGNREIFHLQVSEAAGRIDSILRRSNLLEVG